jgi:urease accessory protein
VLALGLLISLRWKAGVLPGALLVAFFAVFHGLAHGAELPQASPAAIYVLGFTLATSALHGAGIGIAALMRARAVQPYLAGAPVALAGCWLLLSAF